MVASDYYLFVRCKYNNFTNIIFYNFQTNDRPFFFTTKKIHFLNKHDRIIPHFLFSWANFEVYLNPTVV